MTSQNAGDLPSFTGCYSDRCRIARARRDSVTDGRAGAVAIIQRFGGALNLNIRHAEMDPAAGHPAALGGRLNLLNGAPPYAVSFASGPAYGLWRQIFSPRILKGGVLFEC